MAHGCINLRGYGNGGFLLALCNMGAGSSIYMFCKSTPLYFIFDIPLWITDLWLYCVGYCREVVEDCNTDLWLYCVGYCGEVVEVCNPE